MSQSKEAEQARHHRTSRVAWALVRVWVGVFFLTVGMIQLPDQLNASILAGFVQDAGLAEMARFNELSLGGFMPILEVLIGLFLILGVLTPYAAIGGLVVTLWAFLPAGPDLTSIGTTVSILLFALILAKAGRFCGFDAVLHRRVQLPLI